MTAIDASAACASGYSPDRVIDEVRVLLEQVTDPEIPVLTIADLGILQDVCRHEGRVRVVITPTYSGCPAMQTIEHDIRTVLTENGFENVEVATRISPPWTTDWLSEQAGKNCCNTVSFPRRVRPTSRVCVCRWPARAAGPPIRKKSADSVPRRARPCTGVTTAWNRLIISSAYKDIYPQITQISADEKQLFPVLSAPSGDRPPLTCGACLKSVPIYLLISD